MTAIKISSPIIAGAALKPEIVKINLNKSVRSVNHRSDKRDEHNIGHLNVLKNGAQVSMPGDFKSGTSDKNSPQAPMNSFGKSNNIQNKSLESMYGNLEPVTHDQDSFGFLNTPKGGSPISMYGPPYHSLMDQKKDLKSSYRDAKDKKEAEVSQNKIIQDLLDKAKKSDDLTKKSSEQAKKSKNYQLAKSIILAKQEKLQRLKECRQALKVQYKNATGTGGEKRLLQYIDYLDTKIEKAEQKDKKYTKQLNEIEKKIAKHTHSDRGSIESQKLRAEQMIQADPKKVLDEAIKQALVDAHVQVESTDRNSSVSLIEMHLANIGEKSLDKMIMRNIPRDPGTDEDKKARADKRKSIKEDFYKQTEIKPGLSSSPLYHAVCINISEKGNLNSLEHSVIEGRLNETINHMIQTDRAGVLSQLKTTDDIDSIITDLEKKHYSVQV